MAWYYALNGTQTGPVGDAEFQRLVQQGVVSAETLVWREGMAGWVPQGTVGLPPFAGAAAAPGTVLCAACGTRVPESDVIVLEGGTYCAACKPVVLQRLREGVSLSPSSAAVEIRTKHIKHEAAVKSIGTLYYLGGGLVALATIIVGISALTGNGNAETIGVVAFMLVLSAVQLWTANGLRRLQHWARIPSGILSGFGLLGFPIGTLINGYILYLLFSEKGKMVFSPAYQEVIRQTPQIKYKTSIVVWIFLGLILLLLGVGVVASVVSRH